MTDPQTVDGDVLEASSWQKSLPATSLPTKTSQAWSSIQIELSHYSPWKTPKHCHTDHVIAIYQFERSGRFQLSMGDQHSIQEVQQNCMVIIPAGLVHSEHWNQPTDVLLLSLQPSYLNQIALKNSELGQAISLDRPIQLLPQLAPVDPTIYDIGQLFKRLLQTNQPCHSLYTHSLTTALATHLLEHYTLQSEDGEQPWLGLSPYRLKNITDYIDSALSQPITLLELARLLNINQHYFCKLFKRSTGISPYQYILQQRIERAKQLLETSSLSLTEIAMECGFANQSHFTKYFHKYTGQTPKGYRSRQP